MVRALLFVYERVPASWELSLAIDNHDQLMRGPGRYSDEEGALAAAADFRRQYVHRSEITILRADPRRGDPAFFWVRWGETELSETEAMRNLRRE